MGISDWTNEAGARAVASAFPEYPCTPIKVKPETLAVVDLSQGNLEVRVLTWSLVPKGTRCTDTLKASLVPCLTAVFADRRYEYLKVILGRVHASTVIIFWGCYKLYTVVCDSVIILFYVRNETETLKGVSCISYSTFVRCRHRTELLNYKLKIN